MIGQEQPVRLEDLTPVGERRWSTESSDMGWTAKWLGANGWPGALRVDHGGLHVSTLIRKKRITSAEGDFGGFEYEQRDGAQGGPMTVVVLND